MGRYWSSVDEQELFVQHPCREMLRRRHDSFQFSIRRCLKCVAHSLYMALGTKVVQVDEERAFRGGGHKPDAATRDSSSALGGLKNVMANPSIENGKFSRIDWGFGPTVRSPIACLDLSGRGTI